MPFRRRMAFAVLRVQPHALLFPLISLLFPLASPPRVAASFSLGLDLRLTYTPRNFNSRVFRHASVGYRATTGKGQWALAANKDWRADGVVSPVRRQGLCAASSAMASLASVECARAIVTTAAAAATRSRSKSTMRSSRKEGWFRISSFNGNRSSRSSSSSTTSTKRNSYGSGDGSGGYGGYGGGGSTCTPSPPIPLSVQEVLNCQGTFKCNGGLPSAVFDYVANRTLAVGGVYAESAYPYVGVAAASAMCKAPPYASPNQGATVMFEQVPEFFGWFGLLLALQRQPVVVGVMGSYPSFQTFTGPSVYSDRSCTGGVVDHAVLVVGYVLPSLSLLSPYSSASQMPSLLSSEPHWIIRNSWGKTWGNNGDMRMAMVGGTGICQIHSTPPLYPVVASESPCNSGINPCGGGRCVPVATAAAAAATTASAIRSTQKRYLCNCPRGFVRTKSIDGSQSCTPVRVCSFYAANPCGVGVCINDGVGGYGCVCPSGWTPAEYAAASTTAGGSGGRSWTCVRDVKESNTYAVGFQGVTCSAVASAFGLSLSQLLNQNTRQLQASACGNVGIAVGTRLNVTARTTTSCTVRMSWGEGDSCLSVLKRAEVSAFDLSRLNPWLNCTSPPPAGFQVCISTGGGYWNIDVNEANRTLQVCTEVISLGTAPDRPSDPPRLAQHRAGARSSAGGAELCKEVQATGHLSARELFALNPGIYCQNLAPTVVTTGPGGGETFELVTAQPVCVAGNVVFLPRCPVVYRVRAMDTCVGITARFFSRQPSALASLNEGWHCIDRALPVGRPLCVPARRPPVSGCKKGC